MSGLALVALFGFVWVDIVYGEACDTSSLGYIQAESGVKSIRESSADWHSYWAYRAETMVHWANGLRRCRLDSKCQSIWSSISNSADHFGTTYLSWVHAVYEMRCRRELFQLLEYRPRPLGLFTNSWSRQVSDCSINLISRHCEIRSEYVMIVPSTQHINWVLGAWHHVRSTTAILRRRVYHLYSIAFCWGLEGKYFVHHRSVCSCLAIWIQLTRQQDKEICMLTKSPFLDAHALSISVNQDRDLLGSWDQGKYR